MNTYCKSAVVPYTSKQMYELVNDVEAYPEFLPWCTKSEIHHKTDDEIRATLTMSVSGFTQSLTTHNRMEDNKMIEIRLIDGPLSHLEAFWRFEAMDVSDDATMEEREKMDVDNMSPCHVYFDISFEFSNRFIKMALEPFFSKVSDTIIDAFTSRAEILYPK